jgi:hypothetical protein
MTTNTLNDHLKKLHAARVQAVKAHREVANTLTENFRRGHAEDVRDSKPPASPGGEIGSEIGGKSHSLGQSILSLLRTASDRLESETQQSLGTAHTISQELQAAKDRIEKLEDEVQLYRAKVERAQGWLDKIASEIEDRLLNRPEQKSGFSNLAEQDLAGALASPA